MKSLALVLCLFSGVALAAGKEVSAPKKAAVVAPKKAAPAPKKAAPAPKKAAPVEMKAVYPLTVKAGEKFDFAPSSVKCATGKGCGVFKKNQEVWLDKSKKVTKLFWGCPCVCLHTSLQLSFVGKHTIDVKLEDGTWASFPVTVTK